MHKKKDELRDIYQGGSSDLEKDFTPQVVQETLETRQRDLRRSRIAAFIFGFLIIAFSVVLIALIIRDFLRGQSPVKKVPAEEKIYTPRHSLPEEALWIMDDQPLSAPLDGIGSPGPKPVSAEWIKKAAYYIIAGQQTLGINEPAKALEYFQKTAEIYPDIQGLHYMLGMLYLQRKEFPQAAQHLEKAVKEEEVFDAVNSLGEAYIGTEEYAKAEKYFTRALELKREYPACHRNLASLCRKMNRDSDAIYHFEKYLDLHPDDFDTMQTYSLYLIELGRWKDAAKFLTQLTQGVTDVAPVYFLLAQAQIQSGQQDKAFEALKHGIQLVDPQLALIWMRRDEFNAVRNTSEFKALTAQLEKSP